MAMPGGNMAVRSSTSLKLPGDLVAESLQVTDASSVDCVARPRKRVASSGRPFVVFWCSFAIGRAVMVGGGWRGRANSSAHWAVSKKENTKKKEEGGDNYCALLVQSLRWMRAWSDVVMNWNNVSPRDSLFGH